MTAEMSPEQIAEMEDQLALDGMPDAPPPGETTTMKIAGPADAAFKTARWGLEQVREHLATARADRKQINEFIARLVIQERYLARMARIADEFDRDDEASPTEE